jgi:hypothetical protein
MDQPLMSGNERSEKQPLGLIPGSETKTSLGITPVEAYLEQLLFPMVVQHLALLFS